MNNLEAYQSHDPLKYALNYIRKGWPVFPIHSIQKSGKCTCMNSDCSSPGKHPRTRRGFHEATINEDTAHQWWQKWPNSNVGIATGRISNLFVVDIDPRHGGDLTFRRWLNDYDLENTLTVITGSKGRHLYFKYPAMKLRNRSGVEPGVDIRADGGYVVAPPSIHHCGRMYRWAPDAQQTKNAPNWLLEKCISEKIESPTKKIKETNNFILEGKRNDFLTSIAGSMHKHGIIASEMGKNLNKMNKILCKPPLSQNEVSRIAKSIARYVTSPQLDSWQKPKKLPKDEIRIENMTPDFLPEAMSPWVQDICLRMQVPLEFVAVPAIVAFSSLIGRSLAVQPRKFDNWTVIPNLWGGLIARPGFFKSPAIAEALAPLEEIIKKEDKNYKQRIEDWRIEKEILEAKYGGYQAKMQQAIKRDDFDQIALCTEKMKKIKKEILTKRPKNIRYKTSDVTVERLGQLLSENPDGLLVVRDELYGWCAGLEKYGREADKSFYLAAWNGNTKHDVDRITRDRDKIPNLCLSILGGIQPSRLNALLPSSGKHQDDGFIQRFQLFIYPELPRTWINNDQIPDQIASEKVNEIFKKFSKIRDRDNKDSQKILRFSDEARELFYAWYEPLEITLRSQTIECLPYESHIAKYRSLVPSLALIFHLIDTNAEIETIDVELVDKKSVALAIKWTHYLKDHARKIYRVEEDPYMASARALVRKIKDGKVRNKDKVRDIYRKHWAKLDSMELLGKALKILESHFWIQVKSDSTNTRYIFLNPCLVEEGLI